MKAFEFLILLQNLNAIFLEYFSLDLPPLLFLQILLKLIFVPLLTVCQDLSKSFHFEFIIDSLREFSFEVHDLASFIIFVFDWYFLLIFKFSF